MLLKPCEVPELIDALEKVDLTAEQHWDRQIERLTRDIEDVVPVPPPWTEGGVFATSAVGSGGCGATGGNCSAARRCSSPYG